MYHLKQKLFGGSERSAKAKKNIYASLLLKGLSILVSLILIPMTLGYLTSYEYGVWLTLSSLLHWIDFFDIGLGNGLRNKLAESLAENNYKKSRIYVSTTFFSLTVIIGTFYLLFVFINIWIDWYKILNVSPDIVSNLKGIILLVSGMMCMNFVLKTISFVYYAKQVAMMNNIISFATQVFSLAIIFILTQVTNGELWKVATVYASSPVLILLISYPITFGIKYKEISPSIFYFDFQYLKSLLGLGVEFFFLKIGGLLIFSTSNIFISNILSPEEVTPYSIAQKYFSVLSMIFSIIITPMWSAATDAYVRDDMLWLVKSCRSMVKVVIVFIIISVIMCLCAKQVYALWLGESYVEIPTHLNILFVVYMAIFNMSTCYSTFIFGMGKLRLQLYSTFISGIIFVLLAFPCITYWGINGACIALIIANIPAFILNPIQFHILTNKSTHRSSIWFQ